MASPERFERPTDPLEGDCSIQLSYEDITQRQIDYITKKLIIQEFLQHFLLFPHHLLKTQHLLLYNYP